MALVTKNFFFNLVQPGLALTATLRDNADGLLTPTSAVVAETVDPGIYKATVVGFDESWNGRITVSDGAGLTDMREFTATAASSSAGVSLPATRLLTFEYETGTPPALTDVTGLPVLRDPTGLIGVRRTDTGATVIPASGVGYPVAMVRDSVGSYSYQVAENGYPLEYWVEYVVGGATRRQKFVSNPPLWHYATRGQLEVEYGKDDVTTYANLQSNDPATSLTADEVTAKIERALTFADDFINSRLRAYDYAIPLAALPGATLPTGLLNTIALCLAIWRLYRGRGKRDNDKVGDAFQEDYDWAVKELDSLLLAGLPAAQDTDADLETAQDAPVAVAATVDANGCNLDTTCNPCNRWPAVTVWR